MNISIAKKTEENEEEETRMNQYFKADGTECSRQYRPYSILFQSIGWRITRGFTIPFDLVRYLHISIQKGHFSARDQTTVELGEEGRIRSRQKTSTMHWLSRTKWENKFDSVDPKVC